MASESGLWRVQGLTSEQIRAICADRYRPGGGQAVDGEGRREWIVPVTWERAVRREKALWRPGFFANLNSACKLRARFAIEEVSRHFGVDGEPGDA